MSQELNERVQELAEKKGASMAQIALARLLHQDGVDYPDRGDDEHRAPGGGRGGS